MSSATKRKYRTPQAVELSITNIEQEGHETTGVHQSRRFLSKYRR